MPHTYTHLLHTVQPPNTTFVSYLIVHSPFWVCILHKWCIGFRIILIRDGHSFIRGPGGLLFTQFYNGAVCREPCTKLGMSWEERILRLYWVVHAVNRISSTSATLSSSHMVHGVIFLDNVH